MFNPRPKQAEVLAYRAGKMGVSAVPGSGKTFVLSRLAAGLIARGVLDDDQEVLVVTLVNSAVENFSSRISAFVADAGLLPRMGYRVRTLHGLAHDIVRERPGLAGLSDDFQIIDERAADQICADAARAWLRANPYELDDFLSPDLDEERRERVRRKELPELVTSMAANFIRYAKDLQATPAHLHERLESLPVPLPLAQMGAAVYTDYQRALAYRGAVDFDDLIRLALQALQADPKFLARLQWQWPYVLEDEAQDSSRLQEQILRLLVGPTGNWVRVGDPNQAIYETFTTASPHYLIDFLDEAGVEPRQLPDSGRSTHSIIKLANYLTQWTRSEHPLPEIRLALSEPLIQPTPPGDPQPNPPDDPAQIILVEKKFTPQEELQAVADSLARWLPEHPDRSVAVLAPRNQRGFDLVRELERRKLDYVEILRSSNPTRKTAGALGNLLAYLSDPQSASKLSTIYRVWRRAESDDREASKRVERTGRLLGKCRRVEEFIWPRLDQDWLESLDLPSQPDFGPQAYQELLEFRELVQRWHGAALLPVDQAVLTLAQDLFTDPADLAVAHKLALVLRSAGEAHLNWRLPELTEELAVVARNERRFLGFSGEDTGFEPDQHRGKVVVATIHKAKGLEWDRVYLMSVNNYDFPSGEEFDSYISERWFLRDRLNLEAEAMEQLSQAYSGDSYDWYEEGRATRQARLDYISERLRLLYVGITRARRELVITWNTGRRGDTRPALALQALMNYWNGELSE